MSSTMNSPRTERRRQPANGTAGLATGELFSRWAFFVLAVWVFVLSSCTETELYSPAIPRKEANRLALAGRVCTEDPVEARFPVRLVILADRAAGGTDGGGGALYSTFDPASQRVDILRTFIQNTLNDPDTAIAVVGFAGRARKLAPTVGDFTRNPGELFNAVNQLALPEGCLAQGQCRDLQEGIRTARTLIEGDIARQPAGVGVLTQYVIVFITGAFSQPMALEAECCPEDAVDCIADGQDPSISCEGQQLTAGVVDLRSAVEDSGAAGLRFHIVHFASYGVASIDDATGDAFKRVAFAGGGVYQRFDAIGGFTGTALDILDLRTVLSAKVLVASNLNALAGPTGPLPDSDSDGLSDDEEEFLGTDPTRDDFDDDGISDLVEILTGFNPFEPDDPTACLGLNKAGDQDLDGLTDCDESLLGTEDTLVDSDGDGMSDRLEVIGSTDYLNRDTEFDTDGDGVSNGEEIRQHSDPRSTDAREHLSSGYRYQLDDEGYVRELFAGKLIRLTGVDVVDLSDGTTPGLGTISYSSTDHTMRWQDAADQAAGPPVPVQHDVDLQINSSSYAPVQGENGKYVVVRVAEQDLPPNGTTTETLRIIYRERQCINYTVRNIQLMTTLETERGETGTNEIFLFFAQAAEGRLERPGPFRMARIPVIFNPPKTRDPDAAIIQVVNEEFVRPQIRAVMDETPQ